MALPSGTLVGVRPSQQPKFAIIYNGEGFDRDDKAWTDHARRNFEQIEGEMGIVPDVAWFASWNQQPENILPETTPTSHTA